MLCIPQFFKWGDLNKDGHFKEKAGCLLTLLLCCRWIGSYWESVSVCWLWRLWSVWRPIWEIELRWHWEIGACVSVHRQTTDRYIVTPLAGLVVLNWPYYLSITSLTLLSMCATRRLSLSIEEPVLIFVTKLSWGTPGGHLCANIDCCQTGSTNLLNLTNNLAFEIKPTHSYQETKGSSDWSFTFLSLNALKNNSLIN